MNDASPTAETNDRGPFWRLTPIGLINLLLLSIAAFWLSSNYADADLWGHSKYGDDLVRSGKLPLTDPYSYTAGDLKWVNHELLAEVVFGLLTRIGGGAIVICKVAVGVAAILIAGALSRKQPRGALSWLLLATLVIEALRWGWAPRPQIFSYLFFPILLAIMDAADRKPAIGLAAAPLLALWTNFHGGFLFGLGTFGLFLIVKLFEEARAYPNLDARRAAWWIAAGLVALAATLVNPYGIGIYLGLVDELSIARTQIKEWGAIDWLKNEYGTFKLLIIVVVASLAASRKPMPLHQRVLIIVFLIQAQLHVRHIVFVGIAALAWLPGHFQDVWDRLFERLKLPIPNRDQAVASPAWLAALTGVACLIMAVAISKNCREIRVDRKGWPVDAFNYIARMGLEGRMVVNFNWAQYAIFAFYPRILVSFDGRYGTVYSSEILDMNFDLMYPDDPTIRSRAPKSPPFDPTRVLEHGDPNLVLIFVGEGVGYEHSGKVMEEQTGWTLLYKDPIARLYGRSTIYADPASPRFIPESKRVESDEPLIGWVPYPALPQQ